MAEGDIAWLRAKLFAADTHLPLPTEIQMVGGLLKWIMSDDMSPYTTRSALVVRVAACLRSIGYPIGTIQTWDGTGSHPTNLYGNEVILVQGGSSPADRWMLDAEDFEDDRRTLHYNYKSVGVMLLNALRNQSDTSPEVFQANFEFAYGYFQSTRKVVYEDSGDGVKAKFCQAPSSFRSTELAKRFAAIYFPLSAEIVAPCYHGIANEDTLRQLKDHETSVGGYDYLHESICVFRAVTAGIAISIASQFAAEGLGKGQHAISLDLTMLGWLEWTCGTLDQALVSGLKYSQVVSALAVIHSAQVPESAFQLRDAVVAWRFGIYSVVPSLLLSMKASPEAVAPKCIDSYWANVKVQGDDSILSGTTGPTFVDWDSIEEIRRGNPSTLQSLSQPWIGPPRPGSSDVPLSLTIEGSFQNNGPDLSFVGRIGGSVIGRIGVLDVLRGLLRNNDEPNQCPGHASSLAVNNVKASQWVKDRGATPISAGLHTYVPVQRDDRWAIFLLGESCSFNGRLAVRYASCTIERASFQSVVIGYC